MKLWRKLCFSFVIEASVWIPKEEDTIGTNSGVERVYTKYMPGASEKVVDPTLSDEMDEDKLNRMEDEYRVPEYVSIDTMTKSLEKKKKVDLAIGWSSANKLGP